MFHPLLLFSLAVPLVSCWDFAPTNSKADLYSVVVPTIVKPADTQLLNGAVSGSYWISSFITGSNRHQYLILSHAILNTPPTDYYRGSIYDITTSTYSYFYNPAPSNYTVPNANRLQIGIGNYTLEALSEDNVSQMHTSMQYGNNAFNLTYTANHSILYNMGTGSFTFGTGLANEWGMPSGQTEGSLIVDGELVEIVPHNSFSWYDRQWGTGAPTTGNWTWYELHLPGTIKASIWTWDNATPEQHIRAATILYPNGDTKIVPFDWTPDYENAWRSPDSGILYPQKWTLKFTDGNILHIMSAHDDQEIFGSTVPVLNSYEGFVNVTGVFEGCEVAGTAFGLVEMQRFF